MAILITDDMGRPLPQYVDNADGTMQPLKGAGGSMQVVIAGASEVSLKVGATVGITGPIPGGTNTIGKVQLVGEDENGPQPVSVNREVVGLYNQAYPIGEVSTYNLRNLSATGGILLLMVSAGTVSKVQLQAVSNLYAAAVPIATFEAVYGPGTYALQVFPGIGATGVSSIIPPTFKVTLTVSAAATLALTILLV